MKAIIFARVSSKDQEVEGYSLDAQIDKLRQYALRNNLEVLKEFRITESSTKGERKLFNEMLNYVKVESKKSVSRIAVITDKVDRLIRNFKDYPTINQIMEDNVAELHFVGESCVLHKNSSSSDKLMWNMRIVMAQNFIDSMKDHVKRSYDFKIKNGEICGLAPIGYKNITKDKGSKSDVIYDPDRFMLVRRLFVEYSSGLYSIREITELANKYGLCSRHGKPISHTTINTMLKNKFYIGIATYDSIEYPHIYDRLIDEQVFYKCQIVMSKYKLKPFRKPKREFMFKGMLTCSKCGCMYSSEIKKDKYIYLRPTKKKGKCDCYQLNENVIFEQVKAVFDSIYYPPELMAEMQTHIQAMNKKKNEYRDNRINTLNNEARKIQEKQDRLLDLLLEQSITQDKYDEKLRDFKQRQNEISNELTLLINADDNFYTSISALISLLSKASEVFISSSAEQKRRLMSFIFSNLQIDGSKLQYSLKKPFDALVELPKCKEWRE